jgi:hypothetical protein
MEFTVTGCIDCPMYKVDLGFVHYCGHPQFYEGDLFLQIDDEENPITPEECPLNDYPLMIRNKNWQIFEEFWAREN